MKTWCRHLINNKKNPVACHFPTINGGGSVLEPRSTNARHPNWNKIMSDYRSRLCIEYPSNENKNISLAVIAVRPCPMRRRHVGQSRHVFAPLNLLRNRIGHREYLQNSLTSNERHVSPHRHLCNYRCVYYRNNRLSIPHTSPPDALPRPRRHRDRSVIGSVYREEPRRANRLSIFRGATASMRL